MLKVEGQPAGAIWVSAPYEGVSQFWMYLLPEHRGKKLAQKLWAQVQEQAKTKESHALEAYRPSEKWLAEKALALGFQEAGAYHLLSWPAPPQKALPEGFEIQSYAEVQKDDLLLKMLETAYAGQHGHQIPTPETVELLLESVSPEHIFLLKHQEECIGITRLEMWEGTHVLDAPGLVPAFRTPELALALVSQVSQNLQGFQMSSWGESPALLQAYLDAGATVVERTPFLVKALEP
ncbi:hypothetical protein DC3_22540 [Deinococcus cellulosilyticus NBRC 106333 = KACC 11606]|uniref:N-acetyltransferase domain-containing protein n=2 Tax=Deinococcus cellulosilyticus TaxID=401558 RepID=A0A511N1E2_DEIC1|nr:hypothetical protein DC3_22540 [Deinococcus cellulosilyticus NBRC 106333 = KACC 11606]